MRVEGPGVGVEVGLEHLFGLDLVDPLEHALVARAQRVTRFRPGLAGEQKRERIVLDALAPDLVELGGRGRPSGAFAVEGVALAQGEVGLGAEQRERMLYALTVALLVACEHRVGGFDVAGADHVVEAHAQRRELFDVAREEVGPLPIHALEEFVHDPGREGIVDADAAVVRVLQQRPDLARDHPLAIARRDRPGRQRRGAGGQAGGSPGDRDERDEGDGADEQGGTGRIGHAVLHSGRLGTD